MLFVSQQLTFYYFLAFDVSFGSARLTFILTSINSMRTDVNTSYTNYIIRSVSWQQVHPIFQCISSNARPWQINRNSAMLFSDMTVPVCFLRKCRLSRRTSIPCLVSLCEGDSFFIYCQHKTKTKFLHVSLRQHLG